ncbi:MAG TPA: short-chain dehydrogenase, partial [Mycobacterium sp.]|nr:short-chain dehydrogenase [Mycobacterium sp.]
MRFDDQGAVITGAGGGLGKEYALLLAARGARVLVNDIGGSVTGAGSNTD